MTKLELQSVFQSEKNTEKNCQASCDIKSRASEYVSRFNVPLLPMEKTSDFSSDLPEDRNIDIFIIQASPFCNIDCKYCYLSDRKNANVMSNEVTELCIKRLFESERVKDKVNISWHAGEPLAVPISFYENAVLLANKYKPESVDVIHSFQTNAMLITQEWCDFFNQNKISVGVSVDGPEILHDLNRVTRKGEGTFKKTMQGIELLKQNNIKFSAIAVLTERSLEFPDEMFDFFCGLGAAFVGINLDEAENEHDVSSLEGVETEKKYNRFMTRFFQLIERARQPIPQFREYENAKKRVIGMAQGMQGHGSDVNLPFPIISVDYKGRFSTFSPELLGQNVEPYGRWVFGDLAENKIEDMLDDFTFKQVWRDMKLGVNACRDECEYFGVCSGGIPSNKLGEKATLLATKTDFCRLNIELTMDSFLKANAL